MSENQLNKVKSENKIGQNWKKRDIVLLEIFRRHFKDIKVIRVEVREIYSRILNVDNLLIEIFKENEREMSKA